MGEGGSESVAEGGGLDVVFLFDRLVEAGVEEVHVLVRSGVRGGRGLVDLVFLILRGCCSAPPVGPAAVSGVAAEDRDGAADPDVQWAGGNKAMVVQDGRPRPRHCYLSGTKILCHVLWKRHNARIEPQKGEGRKDVSSKKRLGGGNSR